MFQNLLDLYVKYYESRFALRHEALAAERHRMLMKEKRIYREPYIEVVPPYHSSTQTLAEVASDLNISPEFGEFAACGLFPKDINLYTHQAEAIAANRNGRHVVVKRFTPKVVPV
jgi:ATP-dependent helicase YprA (DUF1998 family)